jgi:hypothetical protein
MLFVSFHLVKIDMLNRSVLRMPVETRWDKLFISTESVPGFYHIGDGSVNHFFVLCSFHAGCESGQFFCSAFRARPEGFATVYTQQDGRRQRKIYF